MGRHWLVKVSSKEQALFWWVHRRWARHWLDRVMAALTHLGSLWSCLGIGTAMWALPTGRPLALATFLSVVTSHLPVQLLKHLVHRPRPYFVLKGYRALVTPLMDYSFPSGHTTAAFAMAGIFSSLGWPVSAVAWLLATLVGVSRMYLGHHYPLDVLTGAVIGTLASFATRAFVLA